MLNIPVDHNSTGGSIDEVRISYHQDWQHRHWQAIRSAYGSSPFFESLAVELEPFYQEKSEFLFDLNLRLLKLLLNWLQTDLRIVFTNSWQQDRELDFRESIHPKIEEPKGILYPQVFSEERGFVSNLSVLDLIFNEGRAAYDYLVA